MFLLVTLQKKFIEDNYLRPSPPLLGSAFLHPIIPFFFQLCKFQLPLSFINKKLRYRLNPNKEEPRSLCRLFPRHFEKTTHSYNATQKGWSSSKVLIRCELVFCNWATSNGQQTEVPCSAKQALLCICFGKIRLFYFCLCGCWHFWFVVWDFQ